MPTTNSSLPKHQRIYRTLAGEIRNGRWKTGERLPSEAELVDRFGASRITVGRAMSDLQRAGLVQRRPGSGTYLAPAKASTGGSFGLLIPDLGETEIFEPICQGMMASPLAAEHVLLWGSEKGGGESTADRAWHLCRQYLERGVAGVFFAPLEFAPDKDEVNRRIVEALDQAGIPIVLLDRPALPYPARGSHDLVGIDNRRAGFLMTDHLVSLGSRRIAFLGAKDAAATVDAREAGYREALYRADLAPDRGLVWRFNPSDETELAARMTAHRPDAIVCANDRTAARLMQGLLRLGHAVPDEVRIVGIDDLEFAELLPVPLTTFRQPTREIGAAAIAAMLDRIERGDFPTRDILLQGEIVVRRSCGGEGRAVGLLTG
jgi:GntR family transcriptional regulator of arabinose operon